jgi:hypothetical protein
MVVALGSDQDRDTVVRTNKPMQRKMLFMTTISNKVEITKAYCSPDDLWVVPAHKKGFAKVGESINTSLCKAQKCAC